MSALQQFIAGLPKAELHLHIEGSFEPELMFDIATRNGSKLPYKSVAELRDAYRFQSLQDFLNLYYQGMSVLQTEGDFYDLTYAYCRRAHADNVRYTEIFFDPQGHTERGIAFELVLNGISAALDDAEGDFGLRSGLIICFLRHRPQASAQRALDQALVHKQRILGVGLDSSERDYPPENFASVFARAREEGFRLVAHAGEEGPAAYVRSSLDILRVERIDHGNRALDDADLVRHIVTRGIGLTVCPLSNLRLQVVQDLRAHPLR